PDETSGSSRRPTGRGLCRRSTRRPKGLDRSARRSHGDTCIDDPGGVGRPACGRFRTRGRELCRASSTPRTARGGRPRRGGPGQEDAVTTATRPAPCQYARTLTLRDGTAVTTPQMTSAETDRLLALSPALPEAARRLLRAATT